MMSSNTKKDRPRVVFYVMNPQKGFSGGRYHAWMLLEAAAEAGWDVDLFTTNIPEFAAEFDNPEAYPAHSNITIHICNLTAQTPCELPDVECDLLVVVPHGDSRNSYYQNAVNFARRKDAKIALLNFETPNWFNSLSPMHRDSGRWDGWKLVSESAAMIFSLTAEGTFWAKQFYDTAPPETMFEHLWPAVNSRAADRVGEIPKEKRVLILTRFAHAEHKGADLVPKIFCEAMRGYTAAFMVGIGAPDQAYVQSIKKAAKTYGIEIELLGPISEEDKWREFKRASLVLFPSSFEGYGLPPTEAQYANTPCIAFDLPVLREVNGDGLIYVPSGDIATMREKIAEVLGGQQDWSHLRENFGSAGQFDNFVTRTDRLISRVLRHGKTPSQLEKASTPPSVGGILAHSFPFHYHAIYLRPEMEQLVERWLRRLPNDAHVMLISHEAAEAQAERLKAVYSQIREVYSVTRIIESGAPASKIERRLAEDDQLNAVMVPIPVETAPIEFLDNQHLPRLGDHYGMFRSLWRCGFRKFAIESHGGTKYRDIPWLLDGFVDKHKGQRCFVVGNGPSLNELDMSLLKNEVTMGSNRCYLGYEKWGMEFTYWGLLDRLQIEKYGIEYELNIPESTPKFFPFDYIHMLDFQNACPINQDWNYRPPHEFSGSPDIIKLGFTVTNMMMQVAVNMGCNPIYLIGCDHKYDLSNSDTTTKRIGRKDAPIWTADDAKKPTHFTNEYAEGDQKLFIKPVPSRLDAGFEAAREWCDANGVKVLNATPGSHLNVFPKVDYNDLFPK